MTPVQFSVTLFGFVAGIFNSLPATAASYDQYFTAGQNTHLPFQVKAFDSTDWYLYLTGGSSDISYLAPAGISRPYRRIGILTPKDVVSGVGAKWYPYVFEPFCSSPTVLLSDEIGVDEHFVGDIKLAVIEEATVCFSTGARFYSTHYSASRSAPQRLGTLDGNQIEVLRISIWLDNAPWASYFFGYGLGVVAAYSSYNVPLEAPFFRPVSLPPPKIEGTVVEYVNTADFPNAPGGHYFYSADRAEQTAVDAGAAGKFVRTGHDFAAGGFVPVCRFYGSLSPGPNSHFFTVSQNECDFLKSLQVSPTPSTHPQWNYEGTGLYSVAPVINAQGQLQCLSGSVPVYRAYNNAYPKGGGKNAWDSNHRYSTRSADIDDMVAKGWVAEGITLCAPVPAQ
jgi:hypothetical protein